MGLPPTSNRSMGGVDAATGPDPAFMLFGKQIKGPQPTKEIKEELSPRGVDERGVSLATSSDEEEDLSGSVEAYTCEVAIPMHTTLERRHESSKEEDPMQAGSVHEKSSPGKSCTLAATHWRKRKLASSEDDCPVAQSFPAKHHPDKQQTSNVRMMCLEEIKVEKHTSTENQLQMEGDTQARKRQAGLWSRCPRCNSSDTKFCYFNNYNVNQPRHFCKQCQRYWTAGGTLRNVPVGAGKRKNKHALRKEAFLMSPVCASSRMTSLDAPVEDADAIHQVKSGPAIVNDDVPADGGSGIVQDADYQIPCGQSRVVEMPPVNTNLELFVHQRASLPLNIESQLSSFKTFPPHMSQSMTQLHSQLPTKSSPLCSGSSKCSEQCADLPSKGRPLIDDFGRGYGGDGCSNSSEVAANLADGRSKNGHVSAGLSQTSANWHDWRSNESACLQSGLAERAPDLADCGHPEYLHRLHVQKLGSCQRNVADELPSTNQTETNSSSHHGLTNPPLLTPPTLPSWDPNFWPHFYHMYWLDTLAPLAYSHIKPVFTPQGWAFPFIPPKLEPLSSTQSSIPTTISTSTLTAPTTPRLITLKSTINPRVM